MSALAAKAIPGRPPKINAKMMNWLVDILTQKSPQQMKFEFALWTREMIQKLLKDKFGVKLSLGSIGRLLSQLGFQ
jgi:transposase